jgi:oligopeptide transport system substrate-binding protein
MLPDVLGIETPDAHTLVLHTPDPVPQMLDLTLQRAFRPTPREAVSRHPRHWMAPRHAVTSGAFHITTWRTRDRIELVKAPTYFDRDRVRLERLTFYAMDDPAAAAHVYYDGGCDAIAANNLPAPYIPILTGQKRDGKPFKDFSIQPLLGIYFYIINNEKFPNVHFRRALAHATNRAPLGKLLHDTAMPTTQYMPGVPIRNLSEAELALCGVTRDTPGFASIVIPGGLCYVPPHGPGYDPEQARAELAMARQELGADFPKKISIKFNCCFEYHKWVAEYLQHEWQKILGLTVEIEIQDWKTYVTDTLSGNYDVGRFGGIGNLPDVEVEFLPDFRCKGPANRTRFCDPEFERLVDLAAKTADRKERLAWAYQAERRVVDSVAIIPLYVYTQRNLRKPYVRDLAINPIEQLPFRKVWIDPDWREADRP